MASKSSTTFSKSRVQKQRKRASERQLTYLVAGTAIFFALILALVVAVNLQRSQPVAGEETVQSLGNAHIAQDQVVNAIYNTTPPTSGPHYGALAEWGVYREPIPYQVLLHNLEDGGVVIYYQCPGGCDALVEQLTTIVDAYLGRNLRVVLAPNVPGWSNGVTGHTDMEAAIAVTAWNRILKMDEVNEEQIRAFIQRYQGIDNHQAGG
jgi:hypothetical protein